MSVIATALKHLIAAGVTGDALVAAITEIEESMSLQKATEKPTARQERNKRYYQSKRLKSVLKASYSDDKRLKRLNPVSPLVPPSDGFPHPSLTPPYNPPIRGNIARVKIDLPDWMPLPEWEGYLEMRKKIKKPATAKAESLAVGKLDKFRAKGHDPTEILNQSILNGWQDLYEPKTQAARNGENYGQRGQPNKSDRAKAAIMRGLGFEGRPTGAESLSG